MKETSVLENNLAKNIRRFRKERGLTQEQLADAFGVTIGAVHKWEAGLSTPDISLILEIADFFDTSLDVLVGFEARDNSLSAITGRLRKMAYDMDPDSLVEADKALNKYPNNFAVVFECALIYGVQGINPRNDKYLKRAVELFNQALILISQNNDPTIDESVIYGQLAILYQTMGNLDKALEIYKNHNASGLYNIRIGHLLATKGDYKQADEYLSQSLVKQLGDKMTFVAGKLNCYRMTGNYDDARALIESTLQENTFYKIDDKPNVLDKFDCVLLVQLAYVEIKCGNKEKSKKCMKKAVKKAKTFDADPDYDAKHLRHIHINESLMMHDSLGATCMEAIRATIVSLKLPELNEMLE